MSWQTTAYAAYDLETSGISVEDDRVVTACIAIIRPTPTPPWSVDVKSWLVNPGIEIPQGAIDVHGVTNERAQAEGQDPAEAIDVIAAELALAQTHGIPIVGANIAFDNTLLDRECRRHGLPTVEDRLGRSLGPCIDVQVLDRHVDQYRKKTEGDRKLETLCKLYGVALDGAHDSTFDAIGAARVAYRLGRMAHMSVEALTAFYKARKRNRPADIARVVKTLDGLSLAQLHDLQVGWRQEQCDGLRAHFDKQDPPTKHDGVPGNWPLIPVVREPVLL